MALREYLMIGLSVSGPNCTGIYLKELIGGRYPIIIQFHLFRYGNLPWLAADVSIANINCAFFFILQFR